MCFNETTLHICSDLLYRQKKPILPMANFKIFCVLPIVNLFIYLPFSCLQILFFFNFQTIMDDSNFDNLRRHTINNFLRVYFGI